MDDEFQTPFGDKTFSDSFVNHYQYDMNHPYMRIFFLLFITYLWTLVLTLLPVVTDVPPQDYYVNHRSWYTGDDVIRLIEPIGGMFLNFYVLYYSGIFKRDITRRTSACIFVFLFGMALYQQGAGFHSASNMFSNSLQTIDYDDGNLKDLFFYMRVIWEHAVAHYMYAAGYVLMNMAQMWAFKDFKAPSAGLPTKVKMLIVLTSFTYGLLIAGVAAEFPSGTIVAIVFLVIYGILGIGGYMYYLRTYEKDDKILGSFGTRPILHHFFLSYVFGLLFVISWVVAVGGFKSRKQSGVLE